MGREGGRENGTAIIDLVIGKAMGSVAMIQGRGRGTDDGIDRDTEVVMKAADALDLVIPSQNVLQRMMTTTNMS